MYIKTGVKIISISFAVTIYNIDLYRKYAQSNQSNSRLSFQVCCYRGHPRSPKNCNIANVIIKLIVQTGKRSNSDRCT